jgi:hypothetical protein
LLRLVLSVKSIAQRVTRQPKHALLSRVAPEGIS